MSEAFWQFIAAVVISVLGATAIATAMAIFTSFANAAVLSKQDTPLTATETAKEARRPAGQCIEVQTIRRFLVRPGGKRVPLTGEISMLVPCS